MCIPFGTPISPANVRQSLNALIKKAVVQKIQLHDLRHMHAILLLAKGVNVKVISERLGNYLHIHIRHLFACTTNDTRRCSEQNRRDFVGNVTKLVTTGSFRELLKQNKNRIKR